jgi:hypothetical protein
MRLPANQRSEAELTALPSSCRANDYTASDEKRCSAWSVIDGVLWYKSFTIIYAGLEAGCMFTPEELRQTKIFACLDAAECARIAQNAADVPLKAGEWLVRSGETPWFYVVYEGRLRIVFRIDRPVSNIGE